MEKNPENPVAAQYDKIYSEREAAFNSGKVSPLILEVGKFIPEGGKVIEFGAGQGRNSLVLAEQGFSVTAIELSEVGVNSMNRIAKERSLQNFEARIGDARENLEGEYDSVVSILMLHHLTRVEAEEFILKIKEHTKEGGVNAIETFTSEGDFSKLPDAKGRFYPELGEMRELYSDWEIISFAEHKSIATATRSDGSPMFNIKTGILARKPFREVL